MTVILKKPLQYSLPAGPMRSNFNQIGVGSGNQQNNCVKAFDDLAISGVVATDGAARGSTGGLQVSFMQMTITALRGGQLLDRAGRGKKAARQPLFGLARRTKPPSKKNKGHAEPHS